jgi:hypothetical protein
MGCDLKKSKKGVTVKIKTEPGIESGLFELKQKSIKTTIRLIRHLKGFLITRKGVL